MSPHGPALALTPPVVLHTQCPRSRHLQPRTFLLHSLLRRATFPNQEHGSWNLLPRGCWALRGVLVSLPSPSREDTRRGHHLNTPSTPCPPTVRLSICPSVSAPPYLSSLPFSAWCLPLPPSSWGEVVSGGLQGFLGPLGIVGWGAGDHLLTPPLQPPVPVLRVRQRTLWI